MPPKVDINDMFGGITTTPKPMTPEKTSLDDAYAMWSTGGKKPNDLYQVVKAAKPDIDKAISYASGGRGGSALNQMAKIRAAEAIQSFDPNRDTALRTWLHTSLQQLIRDNKKLDPVSTPERVSRNLAMIGAAEKEFLDQHGRYPSDAELSDNVGVSLKYLNKMRSYQRKQVSEHSIGDEDSAGVPVANNSGENWAYAVYYGLDPQEQSVMEYKLGWHGKNKLNTTQIAKALKISPGRVSQISRKISNMLDSDLRDAF